MNNLYKTIHFDIHIHVKYAQQRLTTDDIIISVCGNKSESICHFTRNGNLLFPLLYLNCLHFYFHLLFYDAYAIRNYIQLFSVCLKSNGIVSFKINRRIRWILIGVPIVVRTVDEKKIACIMVHRSWWTNCSDSLSDVNVMPPCTASCTSLN